MLRIWLQEVRPGYIHVSAVSARGTSAFVPAGSLASMMVPVAIVRGHGALRSLGSRGCVHSGDMSSTVVSSTESLRAVWACERLNPKMCILESKGKRQTPVRISMRSDLAYIVRGQVEIAAEGLVASCIWAGEAFPLLAVVAIRIHLAVTSRPARLLGVLVRRSRRP